MSDERAIDRAGSAIRPHRYERELALGGLFGIVAVDKKGKSAHFFQVLLSPEFGVDLTWELLMIIMIGIIVWAYSKRRKASFDEAANLVFADDEQPSADNKNAGAKQ